MTGNSSSPQSNLPHRLLKVFLAAAAVESAAAMIYLAVIPADSKNAFLFGLSSQRLIMLTAAGVAAITFTYLFLRMPAILTGILTVSTSIQQWMAGCTAVLAVVGWQLIFIPRDMMGVNLAYFERLQPLLMLATILLLEFFGLLVAWRYFGGKDEPEKSDLFPKGWFRPLVWALAGFFLFWGVVLLTGLGIGVGNNYWNKVGVPILGIQILFTLVVGLGVSLVQNIGKVRTFISRKPWLVDLILFLVVWAIAAVCWNATPMATSRFNSAILPPNYASYPFSDAQEYDLSAQRVLQGSGISTAYTDKAFFIIFLSALHIAVGQDFNLVVELQVALLAIIPALLFLLGKNLYSRSLGLMLAAADIFYEINSIQTTNLIQVSNVKMMLSEPLARAGILVVCLLATRWLTRPRQWWAGLMLLSGLVGLATLVRLNTASALLVIIFLAAVQVKWQWRKVMWAGIVAIACFSLALTPWVARNSIEVENPVLFIKSKLHGVIWRKRLNPMLQTGSANIPASTPLPEQAGSATPSMAANQSEENGAGFLVLARPVVSNYFHNLVTSALMIPPVLEQGDVLHLIREPYWDNEWNGQFTPWGIPLLAVETALISLGIAAAWTRKREAGIFPLLVLLVYHLTNAVSVVSGGRYIVPVDWILPFYYFMGLAELVIIGLRLFGGVDDRPVSIESADIPDFHIAWKSALGILLPLCFVGAIPWMMEAVHAEKYPQITRTEIRQILDRTIDRKQSGLTESELDTFLSDPRAVLLEGQAFYPRFFQPGEGDTASTTSPFGIKNYPHLGLILLGQTSSSVNLYLEEPPSAFPNGSRALVLGCAEEKNNIQAAAVVLLDPARFFKRPDLTRLSCPPGEPQ